ncbi:MAG: amino acid permease [Thiotrichales bacterium]|nr:MAG: amino acid permease [Thiotrichales bacterium]
MPKEFKRSLTGVSLMFAAISGVMGSAWLFGPYYASKMAGPASVIAWGIGGVAMLIIAMTFAELSCMMPLPGGQARFIHLSHGTFSSFLFTWIMWLGYAAVAPVEAMGILQYLSGVLPWLITRENGVATLTMSGYFCAAGLLLFLCWLNFSSIKWLARYNAVIVWVKVLVPVVIVSTLLYFCFNLGNFHIPSGFMPYGIDGIDKAISVGGIIFAFAGYAPAIVLAGESKNPQKTIPLVLLGSLGVCMILYTALQVVFIGAQDPSALQHGWHNLNFANDASPFFGIADRLHLPKLQYLIFLTALITPFGTALIFVATSSRVAYAMSKNGYFPKIMQNLNKNSVPFVAVMLNFIVGMVFFFPIPGWQGMMEFLVSAFVLCYVIGPISVLALRKQAFDVTRPFKLPLSTIWCFFAFYFSNLIIYWTGWKIYSHMLIAILIGIVILVVMFISNNKKHKTPFSDLDMKHSIWAITYLVGMGIITYLGHMHGDTGIIPTNYSYLVIAIFSASILLLSFLNRLSGEKHQIYMEQANKELKIQNS